MADEVLNFRAHWDRKAALGVVREAAAVAEALDVGRVITDLRARQEKAGLVVDPESVRRDARRLRIVDAGVTEPGEGSGPRAAWDRVLAGPGWEFDDARAATLPSAETVAVPSHPGSRLAVAAVSRWLRGAPAPLVLVGPTGRGKTAAGWFALACGVPSTRAPGEILHGLVLFAGDIAPNARWDEARQRCLRVALLVVDDITERMPPHQATPLAELVERRCDAGLRTLVTANLRRDQLGPVFGDRFVSRVGTGAIVRVGGSDLRCRECRPERACAVHAAESGSEA
jgi:hypothetical protein